MKSVMTLAALLLSTAVTAQDLRYSDQASQSCVDQAVTSEAKRACVGESASVCIDATADGSTTIGMMQCLDNEHDYWDARLNRIYKQVQTDAKALDAEMAEIGSSAPKTAPALRDMQRAWITYRDATCDFELSQWGGGSGGGPAVLSCVLQMTGAQAIYLEQIGLGG
ncbi:MAG: hypothetical protein COB16_15175 [Rhodobacteraceae bacterium]|nr:MAG: hypothetical protein COB16_15175 [Paracoccaceae bacterium]